MKRNRTQTAFSYLYASFIALGDEIRLTIIEALTDEVLTERAQISDVNTNQPDKNNDRQISLPDQSVRMA